MNLTNIHIPDLGFSRYFLCLRRSHQFQPASMHRTGQDMLIDHTPSTVVSMTPERKILKLVKARSWHEYVKTYWAHSRLFKEVRGNQQLRDLGVPVACIHEVGFTLIPFIKRGYLGYYIMDDLRQSGYQEARAYLDNPDTSDALRATIMGHIVRDLRTIRDANTVFPDAHLSNVLCNAQGEICWIDTGLSHYGWGRKHRFHAKYNHAIRNFAKYDYYGELLRPNEQQALLSLQFSDV